MLRLPTPDTKCHVPAAFANAIRGALPRGVSNIGKNMLARGYFRGGGYFSEFYMCLCLNLMGFTCEEEDTGEEREREREREKFIDNP